MYFNLQTIIIQLIIAVPVFLILWAILKRFLKTNVYRIVVPLILTLILTPFLYLGFIGLVFFALDYEPSRDFDQKTWRNDIDKRHYMSDDIIDSKILIGLDTIQMKKILGEPTWRSDSTYQKELNNTLFYNMGMGGGGFGVIFHTLIVKFENNKVVAIEHGEAQD